MAQAAFDNRRKERIGLPGRALHATPLQRLSRRARIHASFKALDIGRQRH